MIAILALIKVMIDYPGMGDMCMRFIHKKTAGKSEAKKTGIEEVIVDDEKNIELEQESFDISLLKLPIEKVDPEGTSMSRISTDPEICKKRFVLCLFRYNIYRLTLLIYLFAYFATVLTLLIYVPSSLLSMLKCRI